MIFSNAAVLAAKALSVAAVAAASSGALRAQAQPPQLLRDVRPGAMSSNPDVLGPSPRFGEALFVADDGANGRELWRTDGTAAGTQLVEDAAPGATGTAYLGNALLGNRAVLVRQATVVGSARQVVATDGQPGPSTVLYDTSVAGGFLETTLDVGSRGVAYFSVDSTLWRTDGTPGGTWSLAVPFGRYEGTLPGLDVLQGLAGEIILSDGTAAVVVGSTLGKLSQTEDGRWLSVRPYGSSTAPRIDVQWLDGPGAPLVTLFGYSAALKIMPVDGAFVFVIAMGSGPDQVLRWDGAQLQPLPAVADIGEPVRFGVGWLYPGTDPANGRELWFTNGTPGGTGVLDVEPGAAGSDPMPVGMVGRGLLFWADVGGLGAEPWWTDGTPAGTFGIADLEPGPGSSLPAGAPGVAGGRRRGVISAQTSATGFEPVVFEAVPGGAQLFDVRPGAMSGGLVVATGLRVRGGALMMLDNGLTGYEPHVLPVAGASVPVREYPGPSLAVGDPVLGTPMSLTLTGMPTGSVGFVALGEAAPYGAPLAPNGAFHLDPATIGVVLTALPGPSGSWSGALPLPPSPALTGFELGAQSLVLAGSDLAVTTAWSLTLGL